MIPRFPILNENLPAQKERIELIKHTQAEMNKTVTERKVVAALNRNISPTDRKYKMGEEVLLYDEKKKIR